MPPSKKLLKGQFGPQILAWDTKRASKYQKTPRVPKRADIFKRDAADCGNVSAVDSARKALCYVARPRNCAC